MNKINRVPEIAFLYWVIKIAATTLGETGADMFSMTFEMGYAETILIFLGIFFFFLIFKIKQARYETLLYWTLFTSSAIAGTALSDYIDRTLQLGYLEGSLLLIFFLLGILFIWHRKDKTISVDFIFKPSSELFYWFAFLAANTLGTAAGDFLSYDLGMGFLTGALSIGLILGITAAFYYFTSVSRVFLFWVAFVLTRPFGATFGDFLTKPSSSGGIGFGTIGSSAFFMAILVLSLIVELRKNKEIN